MAWKKKRLFSPRALAPQRIGSRSFVILREQADLESKHCELLNARVGDSTLETPFVQPRFFAAKPCMWRPCLEACTPSMSKAAGQDGRFWPAIKFIPLRLFAETWCFLVVTTARCTPGTTTRERKSGKLRAVLRFGLRQPFGARLFTLEARTARCRLLEWKT